MRTKVSWEFALGQPAAADSVVAEMQQRVARRCLELFGRVRGLGMLDAEADLDWTRRVYYALIGESLHGEDAGADPDVLAGRIIDTLRRGAGPRRPDSRPRGR